MTFLKSLEIMLLEILLMNEKEFDLGVYRQSLMKKASLIYDCMAELEKDNSQNANKQKELQSFFFLNHHS